MKSNTNQPLRLDPRFTMVLGMAGGAGAVMAAVQSAAYPVLMTIESIPAWVPFALIFATPLFIILDYLECWLGGSSK